MANRGPGSTKIESLLTDGVHGCGKRTAENIKHRTAKIQGLARVYTVAEPHHPSGPITMDQNPRLDTGIILSCFALREKQP